MVADGIPKIDVALPSWSPGEPAPSTAPLVTCTAVAKQAGSERSRAAEVQEGHAVARLAGGAVPAGNRARPPGLVRIAASFIPLTLHPGVLGKKRDWVSSHTGWQPPGSVLQATRLRRVVCVPAPASWDRPLLPWHHPCYCQARPLAPSALSLPSSRQQEDVRRSNTGSRLIWQRRSHPICIP